MVTVYIHAGTEKTGTSAIQAFLNVNRTILVTQHSCLYPNFFSASLDNPDNCHNHCCFFVRNKKKFFERIRESIEYCQHRNIRKLIISCEGLWHYSEIARELATIVSGYENAHLKMVIYFRRQDEWYESSWKQTGHKIAGLSSANDYAENHDLQWLFHLRKWSEEIGHDNILVRAYEKIQMPDGLLSDFLSAVGIECGHTNWNKPVKNDLNEKPGLSRDILEILFLSKHLYKKAPDQRPIRFFSNNLGQEYKKKPFEKYQMLSPGQRIHILETYDEMNKTIAREYLGREDGRLFYEPWPDPDEPWEPYEGLNVEKIVPIFITMMYNIDCQQKTQVAFLRNKERSRYSLGSCVLRIKNRLQSLFSERLQ